MSTSLNVLMQSSDFYCPFAGVMLESLFYNNVDFEKIKVYLISDGIGDENLKKLDDLSGKYGREIEFIDGKKISGLLKSYNMIEWHGSITLYCKLLALDFIQDDIDRLLYLDSDMIVNSSLKELVESDLQNNIIGMAGKYICAPHIKNVEGHSGCNHNGGMILFDVHKWKDNNCTQNILVHLRDVQSRYLCVDEDILDVVVKKIKTLDYKFNTVVPYVTFRSKGGVSAYNNTTCSKLTCTETEWNNAYDNPVVLHYLSWLCKRPWCKNSDSPMLDIWEKYLNMSPWNDIERIDDNRSILNKIQGILFKILPLGIFSFINRNMTTLIVNLREKKIRQNKN